MVAVQVQIIGVVGVDCAYQRIKGAGLLVGGIQKRTKKTNSSWKWQTPMA